MSLNTTAVRIKVTLKDVKPEVMRRLVVPVTLRLDRLHLTLQAAFGWTNRHLFEFFADYGHQPMDARKARLSDIARETGIADLQTQTGVEVERINVDKGYRGHSYPNRFKVWISGQVRRVTKAIRREMKRRAAVEPVIGHLKAEHRMGRNHLTGRHGDRANAVLAAAGFNFHLQLRWFERLLRALLRMLCSTRARTQYA